MIPAGRSARRHLTVRFAARVSRERPDNKLPHKRGLLNGEASDRFAILLFWAPLARPLQDLASVPLQPAPPNRTHLASITCE